MLILTPICHSSRMMDHGPVKVNQPAPSRSPRITVKSQKNVFISILILNSHFIQNYTLSFTFYLVLPGWLDAACLAQSLTNC